MIKYFVPDHLITTLRHDAARSIAYLIREQNTSFISPWRQVAYFNQVQFDLTNIQYTLDLAGSPVSSRKYFFKRKQH